MSEKTYGVQGTCNRIGELSGRGRLDLPVVGLTSRNLGLSQLQNKNQKFLMISLTDCQELRNLQLLFWKLFNFLWGVNECQEDTL